MADEGLWNTDQVVGFLKLGSRESARAQLSAWGIRPVAREPGRAGLNLYDSTNIRERVRTRRGQGWRRPARGAQ